MSSDKAEARRSGRNQRIRAKSTSSSFRIPKEMSSIQVDPRDLVTLEVGPPGDTWRYSIERKRFAEKSEWFRALLLGDLSPPPNDPPPTVYLEHVDKRAFDYLLKYLRGESLTFYSVSTARSTLDVAHELLCPELARNAVDYIIANLSASSVLEVYHGLSLYVPDRIFSPTSPRTPTAPPAPGDDAAHIATHCSRLLAACHDVIDAAPDEVLGQEKFQELDGREVARVTSRGDELRLLREGVLFNALDKWAAAECRRRGLEPLAVNKRAALPDEVWYSVRYLLMTSSEFIEGPMHSGILSGQELSVISARIIGKPTNYDENDRLLQLLPSTRRNPTTTTTTTTTTSYYYSGKKEREDNKRNRRKECATQGQKACARIGDCIIRVLACVFD